MPDGSILEYLGRLEAAEGPPHMFRRWICPPGARPGATLHLCETTPARGAGSDLLLNYDDVWPLAQATRAILRQDVSHPRKQKDTTRTLVREFPQLAPLAATATAYTQTPAEEIVFWLRENDFTEGEFEIFTDGSWKDDTPWLHHCFHGSIPNLTTASASIVCLHKGPDRWTRPGLLMHIAPSPELNLLSGYPAEATALLVASQVSLLLKPAAIITDCESAVNLIKKGFIPRAEQKHNHATLARLLVRYSRKLKATLYRHTYAHLDRFNLPPERHSPDERGNILADHAASTNPADLLWIQSKYPQLSRLTTTMKTVHESLINDIPLCVTDGSTPTLTSLHNIFSAQNFKQYVDERTAQSSHGNLFRDAAYNFCSEVFDLEKGDLPHRASCDRLIFDKVWQPWNTNKYKRLPPPICPCCMKEDSLSHLLGECTEPTTNYLRKAGIDAVRTVIAEGDDLAHAVLDAVLDILQEPDGATLHRALWLPHQIESLRAKLFQSNKISLDPHCFKWDSPQKRAIQSTLLDISKILGQSALHIMRERNTQTQDALHPTRKPQAGNINLSPLDLYNRQKKFRKRARATEGPHPQTNSRVTSLHVPFVRPPRVTPLQREQAYQLELRAARQAEDDEARLARAEMQAATYAAPFPTLPARPPDPWDPAAFPYLPEGGIGEGPNRPYNDRNRLDRSERIMRMTTNQFHRAELYEAAQHTAHRRVMREIQLRADEAARNDPELAESRRRQLAARRRPNRFSTKELSQYFERNQSAPNKTTTTTSEGAPLAELQPSRTALVQRTLATRDLPAGSVSEAELAQNRKQLTEACAARGRSRLTPTRVQRTISLDGAGLRLNPMPTSTSSTTTPLPVVYDPSVFPELLDHG
jgi:hypothetical protein